MTPRPPAPRRFPQATTCVLLAGLLCAGLAAGQAGPLEPPEAVEIRFVYEGPSFLEADECPGLRPGEQILEAVLILGDADPDGAYYEGSGTLEVDLDGCGLTPNRADPGRGGSGSGFGGFHGDNFLNCVTRTEVDSHDVYVFLVLEMENEEVANYLTVEWEPVEPPVVRTTSDCEKPWHDAYAEELAARYAVGGSHDVADLDLLSLLVAPGGILREGTFRLPEDSWTYTLSVPLEIPGLTDDAGR